MGCVERTGHTLFANYHLARNLSVYKSSHGARGNDKGNSLVSADLLLHIVLAVMPSRNTKRLWMRLATPLDPEKQPGKEKLPEECALSMMEQARAMQKGYSDRICIRYVYIPYHNPFTSRWR